jgi:hydrogenase maturation protein HypF
MYKHSSQTDLPDKVSADIAGTDTDVCNQDMQVARMRLNLNGFVQGVGFRPFVYRLANDLGLVGWVSNSPQGVQIEIEGPSEKLETFIRRLEREKPPCARIESRQAFPVVPGGDISFAIRESERSGEKTAVVLPDIAICPDCLKEIFDPDNRRYRYPFTNCTNCGPRYSIIESLPYDRPSTTMKIFSMCDECRREYADPGDRRFHAQPNACHVCGPYLELWSARGEVMARHDDALRQACDAIRAGQILALKGLGGFQLLVDARSDNAVSRLRERKTREEKPFALMFPSIQAVAEECHVSEIEKNLLDSPAAPIVLLRRKRRNVESPSGIAWSVAPRNPYLGVMVPYTPLHHLLMAELEFPVVATSGNISDEPICIDEHEALERLESVADVFLVHNRPIARQVDDSVVRVILGQETVIRNARGYAPVSIRLKNAESSLLAVGAYLKNSIALSNGSRVYISQHVGDLTTKMACEALITTRQSLSQIYDLHPVRVAADLHPDYNSTLYAESLGLPVSKIQHHYAHVLSCMADCDIDGPLLGVAWDGTGLGLDGTVWGGEFLHVNGDGFTRVGHFKNFPLPGGGRAIYEPRRAALGLLYKIYGDDLFEMQNLSPVAAFGSGELRIIQKMLKNNINTVLTSSAGRLFDAVASILGICQRIRYEGHAAMQLEFAIDDSEAAGGYEFNIDRKGQGSIIEWEVMLRGILKDMEKRRSSGVIAKKFHNTLVEIIVETAKVVGENDVVLTGGCFQNVYLTERAVRRLRELGFKVHRHRRVPPNDGGIALGQIMAVVRRKKES